MKNAADIEVRRACNEPAAVWSLKNADGTPFPTSGSRYELSLRIGGAAQPAKFSDVPGSGFTLDAEAAALTWTPTLEESRLVQLGRLGSYLIIRHVGETQAPLLEGGVIGIKASAYASQDVTHSHPSTGPHCVDTRHPEGQRGPVVIAVSHPGPTGPQGETGDVGDAVPDPGDLTLIFDNRLIG